MAPKHPAKRATYRPRHHWTPAENAYLVSAYPDTETAAIAKKLGLVPSQIHDAASRLGVRKSAAFLAAFAKRSTAVVLAAGKSHRFQPGHQTWNKGKPWTAGGRSAETRFKPQSLPHNYKPLGSERIKDGILERKMTETGYTPRDWVPVHHLVWQAAGRGAIPKGHALVFRDHNRENLALDNLELVTRAELMRRNSYHQYGPEMTKVVQLRGAISRQINKRTRSASHEQQ